MTYHNGTEESFWLRRLVRKQFQRHSGIDVYEFRVIMPIPTTFISIESDKDGIQSVPESYFLKLKQGAIWLPVLVSKHDSLELFESLRFTSELMFQSPLTERYLKLYKAVECLAPSITIEYRAIRNGFSHAPATLLNKSTVETLRRLFKSVHIDLHKQKHLRVFFFYLSGLIKIYDELLNQQVSAIVPKMAWKSFKPYYQ